MERSNEDGYPNRPFGNHQRNHIGNNQMNHNIRPPGMEHQYRNRMPNGFDTTRINNRQPRVGPLMGTRPFLIRHQHHNFNNGWNNYNGNGRHNVVSRPPPENIDRKVLEALQEQGIHYSSIKKRNAPHRMTFSCRYCSQECETVDSCWKHIKSQRHEKLVTSKKITQYLQALPIPTPSMFGAISKLLHDLDNEVTPTDMEQRLKEPVKIYEKLVKKYPELEVDITPGIHNGLVLKDSDVEVHYYVDGDNDYSEATLALIEMINGDPDIEDVKIDLTSNTPTFSFKPKEAEYRVVVTPVSLAGRSLNRLIATYCNIDDRFRVLAKAFRYWAKICKVDQPKLGSLSPSAYDMMVIHHLQLVTPPVLPTLYDLEKKQNTKFEVFPLPQDIEYSKPEEENTMLVGELWYKMLHFYCHHFNFSRYSVNATHSFMFERNDPNYSKRVSIINPFECGRKNLGKTISHASIADFIFDGCMKRTCRYFSVPQLNMGPLYMSMTIGNEVLCEKRFKNVPLHDSDEEQPQEFDYDLALSKVVGRLSLLERDGDTREEVLMNKTSSILTRSQIEKPFDILTINEAVRIASILEEDDLKYEFSRKIITAGYRCPVFCVACQRDGHLCNKCPEEKLPDLQPVPVLPKEFTENMSALLSSLKDDLEPSPEEAKARMQVVQKIDTIIKTHPTFAESKLELFGSSANGFGFAKSDLDICVIMNTPDSEPSQLVKILCKIISLCRSDFTNVTAIDSAKVPIVKFTNLEPELHGDLSPNNTLAIHNTRLLKAYTEIDPRVAILGYAFKYFAKTCDIGDASRGSLSSYAYTLLLIHFLQQTSPPVIPVLQEVTEDGSDPTPVPFDGCNVYFYRDTNKLRSIWSGYGKNTKSVGELWNELFVYYTETFESDTYVVSIKQKKLLTRAHKLWFNSNIAIEDPFDMSHNLGSALSMKMNTFILKAFINARHLYSGLTKRPSGLGDGHYYFSPQILTTGKPPNDRGCRKCGKIGHFFRDCPESSRNNKTTPKNNAFKKNTVVQAKKTDDENLLGARVDERNREDRNKGLTGVSNTKQRDEQQYTADQKQNSEGESDLMKMLKSLGNTEGKSDVNPNSNAISVKHMLNNGVIFSSDLEKSFVTNKNSSKKEPSHTRISDGQSRDGLPSELSQDQCIDRTVDPLPGLWGNSSSVVSEASSSTGVPSHQQSTVASPVVALSSSVLPEVSSGFNSQSNTPLHQNNRQRSNLKDSNAPLETLFNLPPGLLISPNVPVRSHTPQVHATTNTFSEYNRQSHSSGNNFPIRKTPREVYFAQQDQMTETLRLRNLSEVRTVHRADTQQVMPSQSHFASSPDSANHSVSVPQNSSNLIPQFSTLMINPNSGHIISPNSPHILHQGSSPIISSSLPPGISSMMPQGSPSMLPQGFQPMLSQSTSMMLPQGYQSTMLHQPTAMILPQGYQSTMLPQVSTSMLPQGFQSMMPQASMPMMSPPGLGHPQQFPSQLQGGHNCIPSFSRVLPDRPPGL